MFKEVVPLVSEMILEHAADLGIEPATLKRLWLHQANINMNELIARRVLGHEPTAQESPIILDEFANTSSAGSIIAFHRHNERLAVGRVRIDLFVRRGLFRRGAASEAVVLNPLGSALTHHAGWKSIKRS